jgi:hypothetical protein
MLVAYIAGYRHWHHLGIVIYIVVLVTVAPQLDKAACSSLPIPQFRSSI